MTSHRSSSRLHIRDRPCPCRDGDTDADGTQIAYSVCCQPFHDGLDTGVHAPTPEALMRSRYSAYVLGRADYLLATWLPETAPGELDISPVKWLGLQIRNAESAGEAGVVEFVARCRVNGRAQRLHEISRFLLHEGRWYYIDGQMLGGDDA